MSIFQQLQKKEAKLAVIGLGYVGLPIALEFARKFSVIGFDIREDRVEKMKQKIDPSNELSATDFENTDILFTADPEDLKEANFYVIAVPTPINEHKLPDLFPLLSATRTVAKALKKGDYVIYESTVYPGCTEEDCVPLLEEYSGLKFRTDFKVGFSPERINPGDKEHTLVKIKKVVSGCDQESLQEIASVYDLIIQAGVYPASSIKVAEAAKIIENTQRDINIAFMNELSVIFNKLGINTYEVLEAAGTKWNFLKFFPGLVGGHCIGVDPYYLSYKAKQLGYHAQIINAGRQINDSMPEYLARQTVKKIVNADKNLKSAKVLVMGATFKENVSDIRNSKVAEVVHELKSYSITVDVVDPHADAHEIKEEYGFELSPSIGTGYDAVIVAVNHEPYMNLTEEWFSSIMAERAILIDVKGIFRGKFSRFSYLSL